MRSWLVPFSAGPLQDALTALLSAQTCVTVERTDAGGLLIRGRRARYWNVNHVAPLDFARAMIDIESLSPAESSVTVRVDFSGYWHAILIVGVFTGWMYLCLWFALHFRPGSIPLVLLTSLSTLFLCVRYFAQRQRTGSHFDALIAQAIARPPAAPRPPA